MGESSERVGHVQHPFTTVRAGRRSAPHPRRGITVLSLLLLIIAAVIVAIFLVRYLRNRPAVSSGPRHVILSEAKDLPSFISSDV
jgi:hypothetical protein